MEPEIGVVYSDMERIHLDVAPASTTGRPDVVRGRLIDPRPASTRYATSEFSRRSYGVSVSAAVGGFNEEFRALEDLELFVRLSDALRVSPPPVPLVRYHETTGISQDMPAKLVARKLLLRLYGEQLARHDMAFIESGIGCA